jgi:hypothetical protein
MSLQLHGKSSMIYELRMERRNKNAKNLINRYLLSKGLLEKKSKVLYKARLRYPLVITTALAKPNLPAS